MCNGVVCFEDTGELLPDGHAVAPHRPTDLPGTRWAPCHDLQWPALWRVRGRCRLLRSGRLRAELSRTRWAAERDGLTGLANRTGIRARYEDHQRAGRQNSLILLDLNGFKRVNDTFGHQAGDLLLAEVVRRLAEACRTTGLPGRLLVATSSSSCCPKRRRSGRPTSRFTMPRPKPEASFASRKGCGIRLVMSEQAAARTFVAVIRTNGRRRARPGRRG